MQGWSAGVMFGGGVTGSASVNSTAAGGFYRGRIDAAAGPLIGIFANTPIARFGNSSTFSIGGIADITTASTNYVGLGGGFPVQSPARMTQADFLAALTWTTPLTPTVNFSAFAAAGVATMWPAGMPTGLGGPEINGSDTVPAFRVGIELSRIVSELTRIGLQVSYQHTNGGRFRTTLAGEEFDFRPRDSVMTTFTISLNTPPPVQPPPPRRPMSTSEEGQQNGGGKPRQDQTVQEKGPCKFAYGYFFGGHGAKPDPNGPNDPYANEFEQDQAADSGKAIQEALKSWGFAGFRPKTNGNVTRKAITGDLDVLIQQINDRKADEDCYAKLHFQGHGVSWGAGAKPSGKENAPKDNTKTHVGFVVGTGSGPAVQYFWDEDLVDYMKKISAALKKKGKNSALIVQVDTCYAQGLLGELADTPLSNMSVAWSAGKKCELSQKAKGPTPFTQGFTKAFEDGKKPTVEDAHKSATGEEKLKNFEPSYKTGASGAVSPGK